MESLTKKIVAACSLCVHYPKLSPYLHRSLVLGEICCLLLLDLTQSMITLVSSCFHKKDGGVCMIAFVRSSLI